MWRLLVAGKAHVVWEMKLSHDNNADGTKCKTGIILLLEKAEALAPFSTHGAAIKGKRHIHRYACLIKG